MPAIADLKSIITIRHIATAQNERGLPVKLITSSQTTFAKVRKVNGNYGIQQGQTNFSSTYDFTIRFEPSRIIENNDSIVYNGEKYTVNDITQQDEGKLQWVIIRSTKDDHNGTTSGGNEPMLAIKEIHVKGDVPIGGPAYTNWIGSIIVFRNGISFTVKRDGTAQDMQVNYSMATGLFTYPDDLMAPTPNEPTDIYFL